MDRSTRMASLALCILPVAGRQAQLGWSHASHNRDTTDPPLSYSLGYLRLLGTPSTQLAIVDFRTSYYFCFSSTSAQTSAGRISLLLSLRTHAVHPRARAGDGHKTDPLILPYSPTQSYRRKARRRDGKNCPGPKGNTLPEKTWIKPDFRIFENEM
jgi:hypothetical protein